MLPDRVSNPGPLTYESGALSIALRGPAQLEFGHNHYRCWMYFDREMITKMTNAR